MSGVLNEKRKRKKKIKVRRVEREKNRKYTEDGLPIYTEEELGINKRGNTELCPFHCQCCK